MECEVCGGPLAKWNKTGVCSRNPDCKREGKRRSGLAYYHRNPEKQNEWRKNNPDEVFLCNLRHRAKVKKVPFTLTASDIPPVPEHCACCEQVMVKAQGKPKRNSPSLDRMIPALGYVPGNIQWLCHRCNAIKLDATPEEIMQVAVFLQKLRLDIS